MVVNVDAEKPREILTYKMLLKVGEISCYNYILCLYTSY